MNIPIISAFATEHIHILTLIILVALFFLVYSYKEKCRSNPATYDLNQLCIQRYEVDVPVVGNEKITVEEVLYKDVPIYALVNYRVMNSVVQVRHEGRGYYLLAIAHAAETLAAIKELVVFAYTNELSNATEVCKSLPIVTTDVLPTIIEHRLYNEFVEDWLEKGVSIEVVRDKDDGRSIGIKIAKVCTDE